MNWLRKLWRRWVAREMPPDDDVDSDRFSDMTPLDLHVPDSETLDAMTERFPSPSDWDRLERRKRSSWLRSKDAEKARLDEPRDTGWQHKDTQ